MADTKAAQDDDKKLISKILDRKRKTDLRGLLRAQREGRLDEYIAKDLARAKRKKMKGSTRVRSVSCAPMSSTKGYSKIESKQDTPLGRKPKASRAKTRPRARSGKPKPALLTIDRKRAASTKTSGFADHKTNAMQTFLNIEKMNNSSPKRKQKKTTRSKSFAPGSGRISTKKINLNIDKQSKAIPIRKSQCQESVPWKKSSLTVVHEKSRSKSYDEGTKKTSAMQKFLNMEKQNKTKIKRKKKSGNKKAARGFQTGGRVRSQSCIPGSEVKTNKPMKRSIKEKAALFDNSAAKTDVPKLLAINRKTKKLASKTLKKTPGRNIFIEKKDTGS